MNSVSASDVSRPPITTAPRLARTADPGSSASASGRSPAMSATVVMRIGRKRVRALSMTASRFSLPRRRSVFASSTTRMLRAREDDRRRIAQDHHRERAAVRAAPRPSGRDPVDRRDVMRFARDCGADLTGRDLVRIVRNHTIVDENPAFDGKPGVAHEGHVLARCTSNDRYR